MLPFLFIFLRKWGSKQRHEWDEEGRDEVFVPNLNWWWLDESIENDFKGKMLRV